MPSLRHLPALLALAVAPLLGGCTVTLGLTGAITDAVTAQRRAVVYTLDTPPPLDTPVDVVMRDGRSEAGRWVGIGADTVARSLVVLDRRDGHPATLGVGDVVEIRSPPRRSHALVPMLLGGLAIDGFIVFSIIHAFAHSCAFDGCRDVGE